MRLLCVGVGDVADVEVAVGVDAVENVRVEGVVVTVVVLARGTLVEYRAWVEVVLAGGNTIRRQLRL